MFLQPNGAFYSSHIRLNSVPQAVAAQHFLSKHLQLWREGAAECKAGRAEALRGAISNKVLLLRRAWRAWWQAVQAQYAERAAGAAAVQHRKQVRRSAIVLPLGLQLLGPHLLRRCLHVEASA